MALENPASQKIEILSVDLLEQNRPVVEELKKLAHALRLEFGWHYLLDLSWTIQNLDGIQGKRIMDAGAGTGILQWYLAQTGAEVYSVDRLSRAALPPRFRRQFHVQGLREADLSSLGQSFSQTLKRPSSGSFYRKWLARLVALAREGAGYLASSESSGKVLIYNQDLTDLAEIKDNSLDAIVAISSLEHNTPEGLEQVVDELMRVLKPGGMLLATLTAGRDQDWWHAASSGWCYSDASLRKLFKLPAETPSNYAQYDELFARLKDCAELRDNLARFYYQSTDKGMPRWGMEPGIPTGGCLQDKKGVTDDELERNVYSEPTRPIPVSRSDPGAGGDGHPGPFLRRPAAMGFAGTYGSDAAVGRSIRCGDRRRHNCPTDQHSRNLPFLRG